MCTHENGLREKPGWKHQRTYEQALGLDKRNRNTIMGDTTMLELAQINDYDTFIDKGHYNKVKTPDGFKKTQNRIAQYQSMIDALQWIVTIRHFNINAAVMTMSEFHMSPRVEQPNSSSCTYRYPLMMKHASIRVRTKEPDLCDLSDNFHDLTYLIYIKVEDLLSISALEPRGNHITWLHYVDAN
jgi:hypothetical protein